MMQNNQYLIPANTKRGRLIFGLFMKIDMWIAAIGIGLTLGLLLLFSTIPSLLNNVTQILAIIPGLIAVGLVFPIPNYHNVRTLLGEIFAFYTNRQRYVWRGWCVKYEFKDK